MLRMMTLNLWGYADWNRRKGSVVSVINKLFPDTVVLQEIQTNLAFSPRPQSDLIAESCGFTYKIFAPMYRRSQQVDARGEKTQEVSYGLALLSKYPIISSESYFLGQYPNHEEPCSVLFTTLDLGNVQVEICNVHLGNNDLVSDLHLKELMDLCSRRKVRPIIIGDFNSFDLSKYKETMLRGYALSTDKLDYESMPKSNGTLDYVAVPSERYIIQKVICPPDYVSDHRAVFAIINNNSKRGGV